MDETPTPEMVEAIKNVRIVAEASRNGITEFERRVKDRNGRLTWWAVNVLQDYLAAAAGTSERAHAVLEAALTRIKEPAASVDVVGVLTNARETILSLAHSRWSECESTDEQLVGGIDAALASLKGAER